MLENLLKYSIVLASASPRRQDLIRHLGVPFEVEVREIEEDFPPGLEAAEVALMLSRHKADAFSKADLAGNKLVITADTVVSLDDEILGKPAGKEEAYSMLKRLSGRKHLVVTGVTVKSADKEVNFAVSTDVYFKDLRHDEILYYIDTFRPFDKAGAYGIQEWIGYVGVEKIEGSFYNVMGLPVLRLYEELRKF